MLLVLDSESRMGEVMVLVLLVLDSESMMVEVMAPMTEDAMAQHSARVMALKLVPVTEANSGKMMQSETDSANNLVVEMELVI